MLFREIIGQQPVKQRLIQSVAENRISHALLLSGPEGSGSLALAVAYAQYISCTQRGAEDSCGECGSCVKFGKLVHPDLHFSFPVVSRKGGDKPKSTDFMTEWRSAFAQNPYLSLRGWLMLLDAENKQGNISVEECHDIIRKLSLKPYESEYKFLVMWMPEFLGNAGNTLLKIIEEPPPNTLFLLVAENPGQIISTITSRTQLVKVPKIADEDLRRALAERHALAEESSRALIHIADGNYNTARELVDSGEVNDEYSDAYLEWMRQCYAYSRKIPELVQWVDEFSKSGRERQKAFLHYGLTITRECMMINYADPSLVRLHGKELESYRKFSPFIHKGNCEEIAELLNEAYFHLERNANPKILFLDLSYRLNRLLLRKENPAG